MKKPVLLGVAVVFALGLLAGFGGSSAVARPPYKKEWDAKYMKDGLAMFKALEGKSNCNVCHIGPKDKKKHNAYGKALNELLDKDDAKNPEKIKEALDTVAGMPSDPDKADSPTFGTLIEEGTLPITKDEQ